MTARARTGAGRKARARAMAPPTRTGVMAGLPVNVMMVGEGVPSCLSSSFIGTCFLGGQQVAIVWCLPAWECGNGTRDVMPVLHARSFCWERSVWQSRSLGWFEQAHAHTSGVLYHRASSFAERERRNCKGIVSLQVGGDGREDIVNHHDRVDIDRSKKGWIVQPDDRSTHFRQEKPRGQSLPRFPRPQRGKDVCVHMSLKYRSLFVHDCSCASSGHCGTVIFSPTKRSPRQVTARRARKVTSRTP